MASDTSPFLRSQGSGDSYSEEESEYPTEKEILSIKALAARSHRKRLLYITAKVVVVVFAIWGFVAFVLAIFNAPSPIWRISSRFSDVYRPETLPEGRNRCLCGHSKEEAYSLGCIYDSMAAAWLPAECRDDELTDKFDHAGPGPDGQWSYFLDENGTIPLTKPEMAELGPKGGSFWASQDWHAAHCTFYWQKYKRMGKTGAIMEARFDTLHHVEHCGKLVLQPRPDYFFLIEVEVRMNGSFDAKPTQDTRVGGKIETPLNLHDHDHGHEDQGHGDHGNHDNHKNDKEPAPQEGHQSHGGHEGGHGHHDIHDDTIMGNRRTSN